MHLICMAYTGDYVTEGRDFKDVETAWNRADNMGSRWFFYPFCFVTTDSGKTIKASPDQLAFLTGKRVETVSRLFAKTIETDDDGMMDVNKLTFLLGMKQ